MTKAQLQQLTFLLAICLLAVVIVMAFFVFLDKQGPLPAPQPVNGSAPSGEVVPTQVVVEPPTELSVAEPTRDPRPTATTIVNQVKEMLGIPINADGNLARKGARFSTPVKCTDSFNQKSSWLICEPGVILDNTAAWTIPGTKEPWYINVPEGGFTYFSLGEGVITIDGVSLDLPGEEGLNYLVVIRGRIDDGIVDRDLNDTAKVTDFVVGHAIWSIMPPGAYVSKDWFRDQLVVSTTTGGTNCGATGCTRTRIVLFDVDSHTYQMFETHRGDIDNWTLLAAN